MFRLRPALVVTLSGVVINRTFTLEVRTCAHAYSLIIMRKCFYLRVKFSNHEIISTAKFSRSTVIAHCSVRSSSSKESKNVMWDYVTKLFPCYYHELQVSCKSLASLQRIIPKVHAQKSITGLQRRQDIVT